MRAITWVKPRGAEFAEMQLGGGELRAAGVAVGGDPLLPWPGPLSLIRYESGSFSADVTFDADGVVVDYPGLGRMA